ncbi:MAG: helix-turn-helix domain-containing protein [Lachnospiraceae bacterium]|nr:helix-turn-helix domain-containing protein [Lachnospiraceae bacterium]
MQKEILKVCDVAEILGCSTKKAYRIVGQPDFPKITIGRGYYIPRLAFENWIKRYTGKEYFLY